MAVKSKSKNHRKTQPHSIHKPRGVVHPRVQAVGPEHFAFLCVDCAKARSKMMLADFYGRVLLEPSTVEHNRVDFENALKTVRHAMVRHHIKDLIAVVERTGRYHGPIQRPSARLDSRSASSTLSPPSNIDSLWIPATRPMTRTSRRSIVPPSTAWGSRSTKPTPSPSNCNCWQGTAGIWCESACYSNSKCSNIFIHSYQDMQNVSLMFLILQLSFGSPRTSARTQGSPKRAWQV